MPRFDTLTYAKKLQEAGVPPQQAEAHAEGLRALIEDNLATKRDIEELRAATKHDIELVRRDMKEMELRLKHDLTLRLGGMMIAAVTVLAAMIGVVIAMIQLG